MQRPAARLIVLALPGEKTLSEDIARAIDQKKNGQFVVFFGRQAFIDAARVAGFQADSFINTHAGDNSTLLCGPDGVQALPTDPVAGMIGLWTWTGEFVSACTRLGKMPAMYQSFSVPGARERAKRLENLKFHPEIPHEMAPLAVGNEYLADLRKEVQALGTHQIGEIRKVAHLGSLARETGHSAYCFVTGHAIRDHVDVPHAPAIFKKISEGWGTLPKDARIGPGDVIFFVGYDCTFGPTAELRKQGVTLAWSFASYIDTVPRPEMERDIGKDEVFIDQGWGFGDAVAAIPGYDIKILPTSGILAETVLWMASAEAMALSPVRKE